MPAPTRAILRVGSMGRQRNFYPDREGRTPLFLASIDTFVLSMATCRRRALPLVPKPQLGNASVFEAPLRHGTPAESPPPRTPNLPRADESCARAYPANAVGIVSLRSRARRQL